MLGFMSAIGVEIQDILLQASPCLQNEATGGPSGYKSPVSSNAERSVISNIGSSQHDPRSTQHHIGISTLSTLRHQSTDPYFQKPGIPYRAGIILSSLLSFLGTLVGARICGHLARGDVIVNPSLRCANMFPASIESGIGVSTP